MSKPHKRNKGRFVGIPYNVVRSPQWVSLSDSEARMLMELAFQFNGKNNGNLTLTHSILKDRGISNGACGRALKSLQEKGFIVVTRQGWKQRGKPTLVALTWHGLDDPPKGVEYDEGIKVESPPLNYWCKVPEKTGETRR